MKRSLFNYFFIVLISFSAKLSSQTYQLTGSPVITTGWDLVSGTNVPGDFVQLTSDIGGQYGAIKLSTPINLKYCDKWKVEFDFRIDGNGTAQYGRGDGFTFWYLANPPTSFTSGGGLGIPENANGLMVGFDIFNNTTEGQMSKVHVLYGTNDTPAGNNNIEFNNTLGSTFHSPDLNSSQPFVGSTYRHVEVNGQTDPNNLNNWIIQIRIDGVLITNQSFSPSGGAIGMTQGYFGFSAATGGASARHSIKNAKIYIDKVPILTNTVTPFVCVDPVSGNGFVNLTSYENQFVNNPSNYTFSYYTAGTLIANPNNFQYSGNTTITVVVRDPSSTLCDNGDGIIQLNPSPFSANDAVLTGCENNNAGFATFDLTTAPITNVTGVIKQFYPTLNDLNNNTNEITNPTVYTSPAATIYVKVTTPQGCIDTAKITLNLFPVVVVREATLISCFIESNSSTALFNLTTASVTGQNGITKKYYPSLADALNGTNEINNPSNYIAPNGVIYIRVTNGNGCYSIAKVILEVTPPTYSTLLKNKTICIEDKTTLDAGAGFDSYEWNTGATTSSISNASVGIYWVKLKKGECVTTQTVTIYPSEQPVITSVDISNNTITIYTAGGTAPYQYSMDNINWQSSNVFKNVTRGDNQIFVKDNYNCEPINITVVVPNLVNLITPNGDGINDVIDYSALAGKQNLVFSIFDRYGAKIHQGDKSTKYRWDGTMAGRKIPTGSYWYSVTWNENDKKNTPFKYSGWILVKNRE
ncbi:hypothetical protein D1632_03295 [Chryseobacterium nematophagum]|uniref:L-type lectin-like domain-containing protein n=1 Tax=Chryseobacterium nematophagum TaxID=2305228 RepID=A0A3M7LEM8_9FLAO|nr:T9SS type B sorting domain-containing protein [Chryseobacterium nematophagum]RMZ61007.1 hypothetical protein D1632_03295 [Chryseobacterium nematophagum]